MMLFEIPFPNIDPVFLRLGPVQLRWYGLMYMLAFIAGYWVMKRLAKQRALGLSPDDLYDLLFHLILGVMIGGRLGYVLFYDLASYIEDPVSIIAVWKGGMSFHGGLVGVLVAARRIIRKKGWKFGEIADLVSAAVPIGLGLGRIGNFINGELFGRPTSLPWAMVFPAGGELPRHPSQLYEAFLEGPLLLAALWWLYRTRPFPGTVFAGLLAGYGLVRFLVEFVREPDPQIGFALGSFTMGQLLTLPMLAAGTYFVITLSRRSPPQKPHRANKSRSH